MMHELNEPLSDDEIDWLDAFLLDRFDEDADYQGVDEGILSIADLDGLLTAVVSGPVLVLPSRWIAAVWGDVAPEWQHEQQAQQVMSLLMRHMNGIAQLLMDHSQDFEPLFNERVVEGRRYLIVDEWCEGYMRGVGLAQRDWALEDDQVARLIRPIAAFTGGTNWAGHDLALEATESLQQQVAPSVRQLHAYWLARRSKGRQNVPARAESPKVGRNEPCPCGSGKKYKKCCLH